MSDSSARTGIFVGNYFKTFGAAAFGLCRTFLWKNVPHYSEACSKRIYIHIQPTATSKATSECLVQTFGLPEQVVSDTKPCCITCHISNGSSLALDPIYI